MRKGHKQYVTVISDVETHCLIEVIDSHKADDIIKAIKSLWNKEERTQVTEVSIDMWAGFSKVVRKVFPQAKIVYDRFHVMDKLLKELDKIRRQVGVTEKGSKGIVLRNKGSLSASNQERLDSYLDSSKRLRKAYAYKEEFRAIYEELLTVEAGRQKMMNWLEKAKEVYSRAVRTIREHMDGICQYFKSRISSGVMEGINNKIKLIKRQGYGFVNFANFRARLLGAFWP